MQTYNESELEKLLRRYEAAQLSVEVDGDDSENALKEQAMARAALLEVLRFACIELRKVSS